MAIRTTEDEVRAVLDTDPTINVQSYISNASVIVDDIATRATTMSLTVTSARFKLIETYLAAHLYALFDPQYQEKETGKASATFQGHTGKGYELTWWGQMAISFDPTGMLRDESEGVATPDGNWLGTERT